MMRWISSFLLLVTGVLLIVIPRFLFPTCGFAGIMESERAARMICKMTGRITQWGGIITVTCAALQLFPLSKRVRISVLALAGLVAVALFPLYMLWPGVCLAAVMPCRFGTYPAALLTGAIQILAVGIGFWGTKRW